MLINNLLMLDFEPVSRTRRRGCFRQVGAPAPHDGADHTRVKQVLFQARVKQVLFQASQILSFNGKDSVLCRQTQNPRIVVDPGQFLVVLDDRRLVLNHKIGKVRSVKRNEG